MSSSSPLTGIEEARAFVRAIVDTIRQPLLVLDENLRVIVASRSFCSAFQVTAKATQGQLLYELGGGAWDSPDLRAVLERVAPDDSVIEGFEFERSFPKIGHRILLLNARKVFYEAQNTTTILLAIEDVTDRRIAERERDELLRQKDILLAEMQNLVANSLQIIASILLLKARTVASEETREQLHDAHQRALAVASVQRHLKATTGDEAIQLEPYLLRLCASLTGAMIRSGEGAIQLNVQAAGAVATSTEAVSLGLIVTELVINALKHAFPVERAGGIISVSYTVKGASWSLTVSDNGVGRDNLAAPSSGLGTIIVSALAEQLSARVSTVSGANGTSVTVTRTAPAKRARKRAKR
jgi:two-component sensor histidine kinase